MAQRTTAIAPFMAFRAPLSAARSSRTLAAMKTAPFLSVQAWRLGSVLLAGTLTLAALSACTIEMGPPPESDPPLVAEAEKVAQEPAPVQPTEPQPWSRDLDFDGGEARVREGELADGLVAAEQVSAYSGERLTFESANISEKPPSPAELALERARQRMLEAQGASAAGAASPSPAPPVPPEVVAAPVEEVSAAALPEQTAAPGSEQAKDVAAQTAEAPEGDPVPGEAVQMASAEESGDGAAVATAGSEPAVVDGAEEVAPEEPAENFIETAAEPEAIGPEAIEPKEIESVAQSEATGESETEVQTAALPATEEPIRDAGPEPGSKLQLGDEAPQQADSPGLAYWDAPVGTILVQVSVTQEEQEVLGEWERLKKGYPGVLGSLRLVVEEAKLGDRSVFFRVQAGEFASQEEAEAACVALTDQGQSCLVVERAKQDKADLAIQTAAQSEAAAPVVQSDATGEGASAVQTAAVPVAKQPIQEAGPEPASKLLLGDDAPEQTDSPDVAFWDAPVGTILVQVSAIQDEADIAGEWERLKEGYPGVLGPLRLVVEEAKLGDRGVFYRVQAGGFETEQQAQAACETLTEQGQQCFVLQRQRGG